MSNQLRIATIISRIFDPFIMFGVVFIALFIHSPVFYPAFIAMVLLPLMLFFIAVQTKFVSNWDVSDRKERPKLFWPLVAIEVISIVAFQLWTLVPVIIAFAVFSLITHVWKISGHAFASALASGILVSRFGWQWSPVLIIVPLVSWSRVVRKNHTMAQVIVGALFGWFVTLFFV
jgi:membrane-associated phospholipid phosphatase